ncbi:MAG: ribosomal RNA small subunit methyltransferase A [Calditrichaeota bacterium]|nr:MAG: ribosomal RNA small subunit methyltransferase A [Calditrichota bacterium]
MSDRYAHRALKKFSQNFLNQPALADKIVAALNLTPDDTVVEIGPGPGVLTRRLSNRTLHKLYAIELDPRWYEHLIEQNFPQLHLIQADFQEWPLLSVHEPGHPLKVIGNIPYHITSPILFRLRDHHRYIRQAVIMMQKEVAHRLTARPGSKAYGILSVGLGAFARIERLFDIGRKNFSPPPAVDSSVVRFSFYKDVKGLNNPALFIQIVRAVFNYRRKMLRNSLSRILDPAVVYSLQSVPLDTRPEQLSIEQFIHLSNEINNKR